MQLSNLRYVVAVVDAGTFTRAAADLGVAQPSLSQGIRALEAELGAELFHRTPAGAVLTPAGQALLAPARLALHGAESARAAVAAVRGLDAGTLDLVVLPSLSVEPAVEMVGRFRRAHPGVMVRVREPIDVVAAAAAVREGTSEIALTELRSASPGLVEIVLGEQELVALVPRSGIPTGTGGGAGPISLERLAASPLIATPRGTSSRQQLEDSLAARGLSADVAIETDHREQIGPLVTAGAGCALVPLAVAERLASPDVAVRRVRPRISRRIGLVHRDGPLTPAAAAFVALALGDPAPRARRPRSRRR